MSHEVEGRGPFAKHRSQKLRHAQVEFALMIGESVSTLPNWEQGRRTPEGPALALLRLSARNPEAVVEALHHGSQRGAA